MDRSFEIIEVSQVEQALCARIKPSRLDENELNLLLDELHTAAQQIPCQRLIICFGQKALQCLYSVFLAKLIGLQRHLASAGIYLQLCEVHPVIHNVFSACHLDSYFLFANTLEDALTLTLPKTPPQPPHGYCLNPDCHK